MVINNTGRMGIINVIILNRYYCLCKSAAIVTFNKFAASGLFLLIIFSDLSFVLTRHTGRIMRHLADTDRNYTHFFSIWESRKKGIFTEVKLRQNLTNNRTSKWCSTSYRQSTKSKLLQWRSSVNLSINPCVSKFFSVKVGRTDLTMREKKTRTAQLAQHLSHHMRLLRLFGCLAQKTGEKN